MTKSAGIFVRYHLIQKYWLKSPCNLRIILSELPILTGFSEKSLIISGIHESQPMLLLWCTYLVCSIFKLIKICRQSLFFLF